VLTGRTGWILTQLAAFLGTGGHRVRLFPTSEDPRTQPAEAAWGPTLVPDFAALEQADAAFVSVGARLATFRTENLDAGTYVGFLKTFFQQRFGRYIDDGFALRAQSPRQALRDDETD